MMDKHIATYWTRALTAFAGRKMFSNLGLALFLIGTHIGSAADAETVEGLPDISKPGALEALSEPEMWQALEALSGARQWDKLPPPAATPEPVQLRTMPRADELPLAAGPYEDHWESLSQFSTPQWFADAKFGIWTHWGGAQSLGYGADHGHSGQQYYNRLYWEGHPEHEAHLKLHGHPSAVGYKDVMALWRAEEFEPESLIKLFQDVGARYFFTLAVHCDGYDQWDSKYHRWNTMNVGPKKDIVGMWKEACKKLDMKWGVTEHLAPGYFYFRNKGSDADGPFAGVPYDSNDPEYYDLYHPPHAASSRAGFDTENVPDWFKQAWYRRLHDLVTTYRPDMFDTDDFGIAWERDYGFKLISHYYNLMLADGRDDFLWTGKRTTGGRGLVTMREFGMPSAPTRYAWQKAQPLAGWFWPGPGGRPRPAVAIIDYLVECVSKNGNLLLAVALTPEGRVPENYVEVLREIGDWLDVNGEAIYGTRAWRIAGEGPTPAVQHHPNGPLFQDDDIRFTMNDNTLYALCMGRPKEYVLITSFGTDARLVDGAPREVRLLGYEGKIEFEQRADGLFIRLPSGRSGAHGNVFAIPGFAPWAGDIRPTPDGEVVLHPLDATLHGVHIRDFDPGFKVAGKGAGGPVEYIADWFRADEWISWDKVRFYTPGEYAVTIMAGAAVADVPLTVTIGERELAFSAPLGNSRAYPPRLGGFEGNPPIPSELKELDLGTITIDKPGVVAVTVRAGTEENWPGQVAVGTLKMQRSERSAR